MDAKLVELWEANKHKLREYYEKTWGTLGIPDYQTSIIEPLLEYALSDENTKWDLKNIALFEVGQEDEYHGDLVFVVSEKNACYTSDVYAAAIKYGTCSYCDSLQSCNTVDDFMTLCLHIVQEMRPIFPKGV